MLRYSKVPLGTGHLNKDRKSDRGTERALRCATGAAWLSVPGWNMVHLARCCCWIDQADMDCLSPLTPPADQFVSLWRRPDPPLLSETLTIMTSTKDICSPTISLFHCAEWTAERFTLKIIIDINWGCDWRSNPSFAFPLQETFSMINIYEPSFGWDVTYWIDFP